MAPYLHRVTRVTIAGTFGGGAEEWSTGFYMGAESGDADLPTQALADGIRDHWVTFVTALGSTMSPSWKSEFVKLSSMGTDGKSNAADTVYSTFQGNVVGIGTGTYPPQIALVATMTSNTARGVGSKGRMYLPGINTPVDGTGKIGTTQQTTIATAFKTFLNNVNALPANNVVVLASHGSVNRDGTPKVGGSAPIIKAVQGIKVGNVYDTQRRRRNGLTEVYVTQALV